MIFNKKGTLFVIVIILCFVSRLPQLLSPNLILDGDECVVGLMAKHIYALKELPLFFYGQSYGFSLIECLAIVPFYCFAGVTTLSVKLAMLCLWTVGVVFLYKAFLKISGGNVLWPFVLILLLVFTPAWAEWAMKARGGYITAFTLSAVFLYLLFHNGTKYVPLRFFFIGLLSVLIYESQSLWLPGLIPLFVYQLFCTRSLRNVLAYCIPAIAAALLFFVYKQGTSHYYSPGYSFDGLQIVTNLQALPGALFASMHGHYFAMQIHKPDSWSIVFSYVFIGIILCLFVVSICFLVTRKKDLVLFNLSGLSIVLSLASVLIFKEMQPRYLLPVTGCTLIAMLFLIRSLQAARWALRFVYPVLLFAGIGSVILFKDFRYSTMQKGKFGQMIGYLLSKDIHYVYCADYMLTWRLLFYSNERIVARDRSLPGRYPAYSAAADSAYNNGKKTAFVFSELQFRNTEWSVKTKLNGYIIVTDPPRNELEKIFQISK